ncbi:leucine-rich repeat-containing protein 72-like [Styela clava]
MPSVADEKVDLMTVIQSYMRDNNIKRDDDVRDLYLGSCGLTDLDNLEQFRFLQHLWLQGNKLSQLCLPRNPDVSFVHINYRISELYLNDNDIKSISGMLHHLTCLKVLMLQNNQLDDLDETTLELRPMRTLHVLNMLYNPLSQVQGYRLHLIHFCPSVTLFDRQAVTAQERTAASQIYEEKQNAVKATIAFGRRSGGPPFPTLQQSKTTIHELPSQAKNDLDKKQECFPTLEEMVEERTMKKSSMEYTTLDWSLVPNRLQRINGDIAPKPQNITVKFR